MFGTGDGSTTFNLPDLRGEFVRGFDDGRGADSGRTLGSIQADAFCSHNHRFINEYKTPTTNIIAYTDQNGEGIDGNPVPSSINRAWTYIFMEDTGGTETRPRNIALLACIKY
jgi:microcystin-dependent protein